MGNSNSERLGKSGPVQLSVGSNTTLSLNVSSTSSPSQYKISGWLKSGISGLGSRLVSLKINDTVVDSQLTDHLVGWQGCYSFVHDFPAVNNAGTTYTVSVSFNGTDAVSASAMSTVLGGSNYAMCTTIQYSYKPCGNSTMLNVDPQSTIATTPTKTPEEMQQEAQSSGWFNVYSEFSWGYPWYRLHYKLDVDLNQGNPKVDYGWSALPFGSSYSADDTTVANLMNDASNEGDPMAIADLAAGSIIQIGIYLLMGKSLAAIGWAIVAYAMYTTLRNLQAVFGGKGSNGWLVAFVVTLIGVGGTLALEGLLKAGKFLTSTARWILGKVSWMASLHGFGLNFFDITALAFTLIDFVNMIVCLSVLLGSF